jgi:hypothetical protein
MVRSVVLVRWPRGQSVVRQGWAKAAKAKLDKMMTEEAA